MNLILQELQHLNNRMGTFEEGQGQLNERVGRIEDGQSQLNERVGRIEEGQTQLNERFGRIEDGQSQLNERLGRIEDGQTQLNERVGRIEDGQSDMNQRFSSVEAELKEFLVETRTALQLFQTGQQGTREEMTQCFKEVKHNLNTLQKDIELTYQKTALNELQLNRQQSNH